MTESIKFAFGSDARTIDKYIPDLKKYDIIREIWRDISIHTIMEDIASEQEQPNETAKEELDDALRGYETA